MTGNDLSEQDIFDSANEPEEKQATTPKPETDEEPSGDRPRDEHGRFAAKQAQEQETPAPGPDQDEGFEPAHEEPAQQRHRPPVGELQEERRKRQAVEEQFTTYRTDTDRRFASLEGQLTAFQRQQNGQQRQEPTQPTEWFENPDQAFGERFQQHLGPMQRVMQHNNRLIANSLFGKEQVDSAQREFDTLANQGALGAADIARMQGNPNVYAEVVEWARERKVRSEVGTDPNAWFEKTLAERLADPSFQQLLAQKMRPAGQQQATAANGPIINLPSVNRASGSGNQSREALSSEEDIFKAAPTRMGRKG